MNSTDTTAPAPTSFMFRIGLRLNGQRMTQSVVAANVEDAIATVRTGVWANATVASVSSKVA